MCASKDFVPSRIPSFYFMTLKFFDIHSHIQMKEFDHDRDAVLSRMESEGVGAIVVGVDLKSSGQAIAFAEKHDFLWATVGLHPHDNLKEMFDAGAYHELAKHPKVVAIGECGMDYSRTHAPEALVRQNDIFKKQIELALKEDKPLMLHIRDKPGRIDAYDDVVKILNEYKGTELRGNVHFFAGDWRIAQNFFDLGFTISFTGVITFANQYDEVIKNAPLKNILSETDCPFVAPMPYRGKRNEPVYVKEVVKRIAEIRGEPLEHIAETLLSNAKRVFSI